MTQLSEYMPRPAGVTPNRAKERGWGEGWPQCQRGRIVAVARAGVTFYLRREIAPLVATLLEATEKRYGYDVKPGQSWGFACRPIAGTRTPSNHSWGLAVDINSQANPMGATFKSNIPPAVVKMWWDCGFYWGGWYHSRSDAMHFEYVHRPADVPAHLAKARQYLNGSQGSPAAHDAPAYVPPPMRLTDPRTHGQRVEWVQERLNAKGASPRVDVDGIWGPKTDQEFREFQKRAHLVVDGIYGPKSHAALAA